MSFGPAQGAGAMTVGLVAGSALIGKVGVDQTTPGTTNRVDIGAALPAGTALLGKVGVDQTTPGTTNRVDVGSQRGPSNSLAATTTSSGSAGTLVAARATRRRVVFKNNDASIVQYVGEATVSATVGFKVGAGESIELRSVNLIQVIAASGTPSYSVLDEWD